jgi:hypothetical protein
LRRNRPLQPGVFVQRGIPSPNGAKLVSPHSVHSHSVNPAGVVFVFSSLIATSNTMFAGQSRDKALSCNDLDILLHTLAYFFLPCRASPVEDKANFEKDREAYVKRSD